MNVEEPEERRSGPVPARNATNTHPLPRTITTRRRNAARLDAHLGVATYRVPVPYSGSGTGTELDYAERELARCAA